MAALSIRSLVVLILIIFVGYTWVAANEDDYEGGESNSDYSSDDEYSSDQDYSSNADEGGGEETDTSEERFIPTGKASVIICNNVWSYIFHRTLTDH